MESLLNIKEAAEFLKVSEMTIRRWTNAGLLKCYRVGGRRVRRFKQEDLLAYIDADADIDSAAVPLGFADYKVPDGSHITHLSRDPDESLSAATAFVIEGLVKEETVCIVSPNAENEEIVAALKGRDFHVDKLQKAGRLHFSGGMSTPMRQAKYISQIAAVSKNRFRIFGDMVWMKEKGWPLRDQRKLEEIVNITPIKGMLFLCQYELRRFSGEEAMMAIETHSHHLYQGALKENPYRQIK